MSPARDHRSEGSAKSSKRPSRNLLALSAIVGLGGLALSLQFSNRSRSTPPEPTRPTRSNVSADVAEPPLAAPKAKIIAPVLTTRSESREPPAVAEHPSVHGATEKEAASDEPAEGEPPHPITPAHRRIFEENNRVGAMNGAMDQGDFVALRRMNAEYRRDYPEDAHALQEGYDRIADCLERRTPQAVDAARRFWQTARASTLRRYVRRYCLEEQRGP